MTGETGQHVGSHFKFTGHGLDDSANDLNPVTKQKSSNGSAARPVQEIRMGRIRAAIWENETTNGTRYNVTVSRIYKDGDTWKDSNSFGRDDLLIVAKVLDRCHTWIYSENGSAVVSNGEEGGEDAPF